MREEIPHPDLPKLRPNPPDTDLCPGFQWAEIPLVLRTEAAPFRMAHFSIKPGYASPLDQHAAREIWIVIAGQGRLSYDNQTIELRVGDTLYYDPHKVHQVRNDSSVVLEICSIWWNRQ